MDYAQNPSPLRSPFPGGIRCPSQPLTPYNRSHMQLASSARIPDGLLAAMPLGDQKPHQGVSSRNPALYQGPTACNSTTALGLQAAAVLNRVGSCSTGKERDAESGNDYFSARYYASAMGRFLSPDWSAKIEPVPYSKLDNPQTLNLYAYVGNNPLSRVDPTGHADIAAQCQGKPTCNVTLVQTVNIVHQQTDKATGETKTVVDSTLKVTTNFSVTTDAKGNMSASASSTVENVSGHAYSASQLATMGTNIGTMQQAAVGMGFGANTTQLVTGIGAAETRFGTAPNGTSHDWMNPAINPMQAIQKNGANLDRNNNIERGMGVLDWAGTPSNFDPTSTYYRYSNHSDATMSNWQGTYGSITEQQP